MRWIYAAGSKVTDSSHADNATTLGGKSANQLTRAAYCESQTNLTLSGTLQPYGPVTINAPAAGYAVVIGMATVLGSNFCENCLVQGRLRNQTNGAIVSDITEGTAVFAHSYAEVSDTAFLPVDAGSNTIVFDLAGTGTGGSTISTFSSHLSAIYSPYDGSGNSP